MNAFYELLYRTHNRTGFLKLLLRSKDVEGNCRHHEISRSSFRNDKSGRWTANNLIAQHQRKLEFSNLLVRWKYSTNGRETHTKMRWRRRNKIRRVLRGIIQLALLMASSKSANGTHFKQRSKRFCLLERRMGWSVPDIIAHSSASSSSSCSCYIFFPRTADIENFITKDSNRCWWRYVTLLYMRQCVIIIIIIRTLLRATWFDDQQQFFYFFYFLLFLM